MSFKWGFQRILGPFELFFGVFKGFGCFSKGVWCFLKRLGVFQRFWRFFKGLGWFFKVTHLKSPNSRWTHITLPGPSWWSTPPPSHPKKHKWLTDQSGIVSAGLYNLCQDEVETDWVEDGGSAKAWSRRCRDYSARIACSSIHSNPSTMPKVMEVHIFSFVFRHPLKRSFRMSIGINIMSSPVGELGVPDYNYNISNQEVIFLHFFLRLPHF